jgi:hypothetical protein
VVIPVRAPEPIVYQNVEETKSESSAPIQNVEDIDEIRELMREPSNATFHIPDEPDIAVPD